MDVDVEMIEVVIEASNKLTSKKVLKIYKNPLTIVIVGGIGQQGIVITISQIYAQKYSKKNPY